MVGLLGAWVRECSGALPRGFHTAQCAGTFRDRGADVNVATWQGESRFTIDKVAEPVAGPGQVVVAVHAAGICGTDVHATQGLFPWKPPLVLGHEDTGVVRDVGRGVNR